ncbi:MAG: NAD(P)/FAD-dependent oxidoreductase [Pseudomonadota bacterium]
MTDPRNSTRRQMLTGMAGLGAGLLMAQGAFAQTRAKLVVVGGGFGGASAARTLKSLMPNADVSLVEPNETYIACPFSNLVIAGERDPAAQAFSYDALRRDGIRVIHARAFQINTSANILILDDESALPYDRMILSPGIDLRDGAIEGYGPDAHNFMPHAWKAGAQTTLLGLQLRAMPDNGLVVMSIPAAPYRCPPGPYERASLIAHYLKTSKPQAKLILLDAKDQFSKKPLFLEAWAEHYPDHLEWRSATDDGRVSRVDHLTLTVETDFETFKPDVANIIPPQKAAAIADEAGVTDATGWCPIDPVSFESTRRPDIHVIGDAAIAAPMPKSAFAANAQAKLCAIQIARLVSGVAPTPSILANTCYSYVTPAQAVSVSGVYSNDSGRFTERPGAGGLSPLAAEDSIRFAEADQADAWFEAITQEAFG